MSHNVVLFSHRPSERTKAFIKTLPGEWRAYRYYFGDVLLKDIPEAVTKLIEEIDQQVDIRNASKVLMVPPGLSVAVPVFSEAIRGLSGHYPDVLLLLRTATNDYVPVGELPIIEVGKVYEHFRKQRATGEVVSL